MILQDLCHGFNYLFAIDSGNNTSNGGIVQSKLGFDNPGLVMESGDETSLHGEVPDSVPDPTPRSRHSSMVSTTVSYC